MGKNEILVEGFARGRTSSRVRWNIYKYIYIYRERERERERERNANGIYIYIYIQMPPLSQNGSGIVTHLAHLVYMGALGLGFSDFVVLCCL